MIKEKRNKFIDLHPVVSSVLASILTFVSMAYLDKFQLVRIVEMFGGLTHRDKMNLVLPSPVDYFESVRDGKFIRYSDFTAGSSFIDWGKDDDMVLQEGLEPDREIFKRTLKIKYRSIVWVNLSVGGRYNPKDLPGKFAIRIFYTVIF